MTSKQKLCPTCEKKSIVVGYTFSTDKDLYRMQCSKGHKWVFQYRRGLIGAIQRTFQRMKEDRSSTPV